jgi:katanin p80 WD40 repeat-containing subunit B1
MSQRLTSIRILKRLWVKGDLQDVIEYIETISKGTVHDPSQLILLADLFLSVELKGSNFTLDFCVGFMVVLESMISINERLSVNVVVSAALKGFTELCDGFGELIRSSRAMKMSGGGGVDLSREERLRKCNVCHAVVDRLKGKLDRIRQIHRTDTKLLRIIDRLTPLIELIVPF